MYKIIGADQKEYGPISADQMRRWITEGRVNAATMAQAEGETTWKSISSFPEFASGFSAGPGAPPPLGGAGVPDAGGRATALSKVNGPAIGLMVTGALTIAYALFSIISNIAGFGMAQMRQFNTGQDAEMTRVMQFTSGPIGIATGLLGVALGVFVIFGAVKMKKLENHGLGIGASIVAMLPCTCCCVLGLPIGIWALVVLSKPEVKAYFS